MALTKVIYNEPVGPGHLRLGLRWKTPVIYPGQFVMLRVSKGLDPLLRRPFGIYDVLDAEKKGQGLSGEGIEILYRVKGRGTAIMSGWSEGDEVDLLGPLGRGFPGPEKEARAVMVAGGVGIAPLYLLARTVDKGVFLFGARSRDEASLAADLNKLSIESKVATEDGSTGVKGLVTDLLEEELEEGGAVVYACGPTGMLKAVAAIAERRRVRCFVSLEKHMACGMGACLGCAVKDMEKETHYRMVCSDGPVFDSKSIDWEYF